MDAIKYLGIFVVVTFLISLGDRFPMLGKSASALFQFAYTAGSGDEDPQAETAPKASAAALRPPPGGAAGTYFLDTGSCVMQWQNNAWKRVRCDG